ncbi:unnamed protein product [Orchesella dallaii]|uniref:SHSP domain-containing protein n=1 Tax=Orchesella dallaii TaxID=48710 RepID=A0ABP1R9H2_9HEXA
MSIVFERDPWGWVHPFYRRRPLLNNWDDFFLPPMNNMMSNMKPLMEQGPPFTPWVINKGLQSDKFEIQIEVQQFAPAELDVKIVNNFLVIEGKHEEKRDEHGFVSRHFLRKYSIPPNVKPETIACDLSSDGILQISAPRMIEEKNRNEKIIPIIYTGQPAVPSVQGEGKNVSGSIVQLHEANAA